MAEITVKDYCVSCGNTFVAITKDGKYNVCINKLCKVAGCLQIGSNNLNKCLESINEKFASINQPRTLRCTMNSFLDFFGGKSKVNR